MQSLNLPGDITVMIIVYKMRLKRYTPGRDKLSEIIKLIKILSDPGVDKINYYVNLVIEKYLLEFRMTPELFAINEQQIAYMPQELIPALLKYDCFAGNDRIWIKKGKFAIKIYDGYIIIVFPGGLHVWFLIQNKSEKNQLCVDLTKKMVDSSETRANRSPGAKLLDVNEIFDNMIEWSKRLEELYDKKFDADDIWFYSLFLQPGVIIDHSNLDSMCAPWPLTDLIKQIKLRDS